MYCPSCGKENDIEQKFCRTCGLNLEPSALSVLEQKPGGGRAAIRRQERNLERFGTIAFTGLAIAIVLGVLAMMYAILDRFVFSGDNPLIGVLLMAFLLFAMLALAYVFWREHLNDKRKTLQSTPAAHSLPTPPTGKLLNESTIDLVPSVVEETTTKLRIEKR
jgi:ABC-type bacteriocin/lantibiotic exporter with double-glycine peptidase domain